MLLEGSTLVRFLVGLIIASISNEIFILEVSAAESSKIGSTKFIRPDYSEYYSSKVAAAIKDHKEYPESTAHASENIYKHIEIDPLGIERYINRGFNDEEKAHETKVDPSYVSYEVPVKELAKHKRESEYEAAIDALDKEYSIPTTYKLKDDIKIDESNAEYVKSASSNDASFSSKSPKYSLDESSFGGSSFEYKVPHYNTRHTETPLNDKYVKSSDQNHEFQPSEIQRASQKSSNCKKIVKEGASKDIPMTCHVCKDPKTGAKSEQCSYVSAPEPKSFYSAKNEKYSQPHKAENIRFRRYAPKKEKDEFVDPYEYVKAESQKYFSKPKEFDSGYYKPNKDYFEEYKFPEDYFAGDTNIKSESEIQSEKLVKDGGVCKEVVKNNMKCKVCKNEKTGGNYEQCSYTSAPSEKKYAYVSERKFDGDGNPIEDKVEESSEPKVAKIKLQDKQASESKSSEVKSEEKIPAEKSIRGSRRTKLIDDNPYDIPKHFLEDTQKNEKLRTPGLNPELYGSADSSFESQKEKYIPDEYQQKLFPKLNKEASNDAKQNLQEFQTEDNKKDVEKVLEEFSKKDRSSCKKAHKNGMTCYLCVNKEGSQHEECMYVAANNPQVSHMAYHEVEEFKNKAKPEEAAASTVKETEVNAPVKRKRFFKKVTSLPSNIQAAPSDVKPTKTKYVSPAVSSGENFKTPRKLRRSRNFSGNEPVFAESKIQETKVKKTEYKEPHLPTPQEFVVGEAEGAFSSETKPVYSKAFGVTLPRYMLEKSEFEKNFDEFSSS